MASPVARGETVTGELSYTRPTGAIGLWDNAGNQISDFSDAPVTNARPENAPASGAPAVAGTARVGETLTASTADIAGEDGLAAAAFA